MPKHVHGIVVIRERLVDVWGRVSDGGVGADGVGARHDAPETPTNAPGIRARDASGKTTITNIASFDDPGTPGGHPDTVHARAHHTRAHHDAADPPPHDPRDATQRRPGPIGKRIVGALITDQNKKDHDRDHRHRIAEDRSG